MGSTPKSGISYTYSNDPYNCDEENNDQQINDRSIQTHTATITAQHALGQTAQTDAWRYGENTLNHNKQSMRAVTTVVCVRF